VNWTLEVVVVPVTDVDRAKSFYADQLGFVVDHDTTVSDQMRFVQLTPPGSGCSIVVGQGITDMQPGAIKGLQLVVSDIVAAHAQLLANGVEAGEIQVFDGDESRLIRGGTALDNVGFVFFNDPDGNGWAVQQISARG
jgi:catechol 2,3-dioxygenase-like lactoylglutathione lyase family enzyme